MAELQERISSHEFSEWVAFMSAEPLGELRSDFHAALICSVLAEINRDKNQKSSSFTASDFIPEWWQAGNDEERQEEQRRMDSDTMLAKMRAILPPLQPKEGAPSQP